jgi:hypothetical protein
MRLPLDSRSGRRLCGLRFDGPGKPDATYRVHLKARFVKGCNDEILRDCRTELSQLILNADAHSTPTVD